MAETDSGVQVVILAWCSPEPPSGALAQLEHLDLFQDSYEPAFDHDLHQNDLQVGFDLHGFDFDSDQDALVIGLD